MATKDGKIKIVLMLCYYFPPLADVGCRRSVAFSKYFKKYGWEPYVVSVRNPDKHYCLPGGEKPPEGMKVSYCYSVINLHFLAGKLNALFVKAANLARINIKRNYLYDLICVPDHFIGWMPLSILHSFKKIRRYGIDVIYVSCPPFSSAISGVILKRLTGKKLVLDFRDLFALPTPAFGRMWSFKKLTFRMIETFLFRNLDLLIVTTEDTKREYIEQYPWMANKVYTIRNGFDEEYLISGMLEKFEKFTVCYTGQIYLYDPELQAGTHEFFKALRFLKEQKAISSSNFNFLYYGVAKEEVRGLAKEYSVEDLVTANGRIPYKEILKVIASCHYQLIKLKKHMISTKLYEGIPLNIPYLATIQSKEAEKIIQKYSPSSLIVSGESYQEIAEALLAALEKWRDGKIKNNRIRAFLGDFSREKQTIDLVKIMESNL